ncbi:TetR family transcriptional regulator [Bacillus lacus]|uniref:TetR family transcriptional regulator n=1 Tax=Metabacillus lacus TaxID=1983721 RepID=A0A7X2LWA1_9BACI|nr:TetR/AcrR family transcriptional regulator [Metabacillus lacus]MRX71255.1 TetR family transcriptional regulator [Metabacillus lacus]
MNSKRRNLTKEDIISATTELFLSEGYSHVSMRKIAAKIGCSSTNLYNHFQNKEEILEYLLKDGYALFLETLEQSVKKHSHSDPLVQLKTLMSSYIQFGLQHPGYYRLMFIHNIEGASQIDTQEETDMLKGFSLLLALAEQAAKEKRITHENPHIVAQSLWASMHGLTSLFLTFPNLDWGDRDALISTHIDTFIKGFT